MARKTLTGIIGVTIAAIWLGGMWRYGNYYLAMEGIKSIGEPSAMRICAQNSIKHFEGADPTRKFIFRYSKRAAEDYLLNEGR